MAMKKQDDQHEHTFSNYVRIQDVVLKTCLRRWTIETDGERWAGRLVQAVLDNDDDKQKLQDIIDWPRQEAIIHSYLPTFPFGQDMTLGQIFKRSVTGLNSLFSFS